MSEPSVLLPGYPGTRVPGYWQSSAVYRHGILPTAPRDPEPSASTRSTSTSRRSWYGSLYRGPAAGPEVPWVIFLAPRYQFCQYWVGLDTTAHWWPLGALE
eukprot:3296118-Rhodomonas_salina.3